MQHNTNPFRKSRAYSVWPRDLSSNILHCGTSKKKSVRFSGSERLERSPGKTAGFPACLLYHNSNLENPYSLDYSLVNLYTTDLIIRKFIQKPLLARVSTPVRSNIFQFSDRSRKRLMFVCRNSGHHIKSQVCLTFHNSCPIDGASLKQTLNNFLTKLRYHYRGVYYLWCLEFQGSGQPHIHLFTDILPTRINRQIVARFWNTATKESQANLEFTAHHKNFFTWNMTSGSYLSKQYMSKESQKKVPVHYQNVGRFWGASRNMTPSFELVTMDLFDDPCIYKKALRIAIKCYERKLQGYIKKKTGKIVKLNLRRKHQTRTIPNMGPSFIRLLKYYWFYGIDITGARHEPYDPLNCPSFELGVPF